jgi:hypothetical protein
MVEGETIMPIPGGDITSTQTWGDAPVEEVEVVEEELPSEPDTVQEN